MTTITIDRAVVEQALGKIGKAYAKVSALCSGDERWTMSVPVRPDYDHDVVISDALNAASGALLVALAEQPAEQSAEHGEPVAWMCSNNELMHMGYQRFAATPGGDWNIPVYAAPTLAKPAERQPLTDDEIDALELPPSGTATVRDLVRLIEAAHGIEEKK